MRWKKYCNASKLLPFALTTLVTLAVFLFLETSYDERWYYKPVSDCNFTSDLELETIEMADKIQQIFQRNHVTYFVCRGSLWGILRFQKLQPWDKDLDICLLYDEWNLIDAGYMYRQFRWEQLGLSYNGRQGIYENIKECKNYTCWLVGVDGARLNWGGIALQVCCPGILVYLFLWLLSCKFLWGAD